MVDVNLARKANEFLKSGTFDRKYHVSSDFIRNSRIFDEVKDTVIYVGSGVELSTLFLFENASTYIHQNLTDSNLPPALQCLTQIGIITDLNIVSNEDFRRESNFRYKGIPKKLLEVHGGNQDFGEAYGSNGDIAFNIPDEVKQNLNAIYFFGMPYPESIRCIQINLLPYLQIGGLFEGPYPYANGIFEGASPEKLGLSYFNGTFVKTKHIAGEDIQRTIRYSLDDYINYLLDLKQKGWFGVNIHPKMKHKAMEKGIERRQSPVIILHDD